MKYLNLYLVLFFVNACSSSNYDRKVQVRQEASIYYNENEVKKVKAGGEVLYDGRSMLVESPGHISVLIVPVEKGKQNIKINLKRFGKDYFNDSLNQIYNRDLTFIFSQVHEIQKLLQKSKGQEALAKLHKIKEKYPKLTYLNFLEASIHYMVGNKEKTKKILEVALAEYPNHQDALSLYTSLLKKGEANKFAGDKR